MKIETHVKIAPGADGKRTYPYHGRADNGKVVLFKHDSTGTIVVAAHDPSSIGSHSITWDESKFKPLPPGSVITTTIGEE